MCPIGEDGSPARHRSDHWAKYIVNGVLEEFGYVVPAVRADDLAKPGQITRQIIEQIRTAHLVVADLTEENPNVFYELALRHVTNKPVIMFRGEKVPPFDVGTLRAISYRVDDLEVVEDARRAFREHVDHVDKNYDSVGHDNPVGSALEFQALTGTGEPRDAAIAQGLDEVRNLAGAINSIARQKPTTYTTTGSFPLNADLLQLKGPATNPNGVTFDPSPLLRALRASGLDQVSTPADDAPQPD
jgi:hypothetical protein